MPNRRYRGSSKTHKGCHKRRLRAANKAKLKTQGPKAPYPKSEPIPLDEVRGLPSWGFNPSEYLECYLCQGHPTDKLCSGCEQRLEKDSQ